MNIDQAFPSKYLKAADFPTPTQQTIKMVAMEKVGDDGEKPVLYVNEKESGIVLNKTNANMVSYFYGPETGNWTGKPVVVRKEPVEYGGRIVEGIRMSAPEGTPPFGVQPQPQQQPQQQQAPQQQPQQQPEQFGAATYDEPPY